MIIRERERGERFFTREREILQGEREILQEKQTKVIINMDSESLILVGAQFSMVTFHQRSC